MRVQRGEVAVVDAALPTLVGPDGGNRSGLAQLKAADPVQARVQEELRDSILLGAG
jgi:hypothetical protein